MTLDRMALGETIGSEFLRMINQSPQNPSLSANLYLALLGDPTLRVQTIKPPLNLSASSGTTVNLSWTTPGESGVQYPVERAAGADYYNATWIKLTTTGSTTYTDNQAPAGQKTYRVRAFRPITSGSGSYDALSQGVLKPTN